MISKFSVNCLKASVPKFPFVSFYSTTKVPSDPCKNDKAAPKSELSKQRKDWRLELAGPCDTNQILCFVKKNFLNEDQLCKTLIPCQQPRLLDDIFRKKVDQGLTIVARQCSDDKAIVGVSINEKSGKLDGVQLCKMSKEIEDCNLRKLIETWSFIHLDPKINEKLCQDELFHVAILSVAESHYGKGIGLAMVEKSLKLARDKKFNFAKMSCTSENTRKIAEQLKMQKFWSASYKDLLCRGSITPRAFPNPPHDNVSVYCTDLKSNC